MSDKLKAEARALQALAALDTVSMARVVGFAMRGEAPKKAASVKSKQGRRRPRDDPWRMRQALEVMRGASLWTPTSLAGAVCVSSYQAKIILCRLCAQGLVVRVGSRKYRLKETERQPACPVGYEARVMKCIGRDRSASILWVACNLAITKTQARGALRRLRRKGLVEPAEKPGESPTYRLTKEGLRCLKK